MKHRFLQIAFGLAVALSLSVHAEEATGVKDLKLGMSKDELVQSFGNVFTCRDVMPGIAECNVGYVLAPVLSSSEPRPNRVPQKLSTLANQPVAAYNIRFANGRLGRISVHFGVSGEFGASIDTPAIIDALKERFGLPSQVAKSIGAEMYVWSLHDGEIRVRKVDLPKMGPSQFIIERHGWADIESRAKRLVDDEKRRRKTSDGMVNANDL